MATNAVLEHMHDDIEVLKRDIAVIKHVLIEEGQLTKETELELEAARKTPKIKYISHELLKKKLL